MCLAYALPLIKVTRRTLVRPFIYIICLWVHIALVVVNIGIVAPLGRLLVCSSVVCFVVLVRSMDDIIL